MGMVVVVLVVVAVVGGGGGGGGWWWWLRRTPFVAAQRVEEGFAALSASADSAWRILRTGALHLMDGPPLMGVGL